MTRYLRAEKYDPEFIRENWMDPEPLSWYPWARWAKERRGFNDVVFLDADARAIAV